MGVRWYSFSLEKYIRYAGGSSGWDQCSNCVYMSLRIHIDPIYSWEVQALLLHRIQIDMLYICPQKEYWMYSIYIQWWLIKLKMYFFLHLLLRYVTQYNLKKLDDKFNLYNLIFSKMYWIVNNNLLGFKKISYENSVEMEREEKFTSGYMFW